LQLDLIVHAGVFTGCAENHLIARRFDQAFTDAHRLKIKPRPIGLRDQRFRRIAIETCAHCKPLERRIHADFIALPGCRMDWRAQQRRGRRDEGRKKKPGHCVTGWMPMPRAMSVAGTCV